MKKNLLFALDIGTRSVVGLVGEKSETGIEIIHCERLEHHTRAMLDGQINDVPEVVKVIAEIKNKLEEQCGKLKKVSVAAAGRALCTIKAESELSVGDRGPLTKSDEHALELAAIQTAQYSLATSSTVNDPTAYYCVGYSVVSFSLDGTALHTLVGQRGKQAQVELIVTFLPKQVIDSLQSAISEVGLEMATLTLEPIAAITVLIPQTMRHLNLVLVDVGAGTSDVAITRDGSVVGYGMVPCAGDEITEAISQKYLLDFNVAEKIKRSLNDPRKKKVSFKDVLGISHSAASQDIITAITPDVAQLAQAIAVQIMTLNNAPPQAVLLVGGGSLTPLLPELLAQALDIPAPRVAVRRPENIDGLSKIPVELFTPDAVTPLGILKLSASPTLNFITVTINNQPLRLFNLGQLTIADALLAAGIDVRGLRGRPGLGITININDTTKFFPGTMGKAGSIEQNGRAAELTGMLADGDVIHVIKGIDGTTPQLKLSDVIEQPAPLTLAINDNVLSVPPLLLVNNAPADPEALLHDRDVVIARQPATLQEVLSAASFEVAPVHYKYTINGTERIYSAWPSYTINDQPAQPATAVICDDIIEIVKPPAPTLGELLGLNDDSRSTVHVTFNGAPCQIPLRRSSITQNGKPAFPSDQAAEGSTIDFSINERQHPMVSDVLLAADFNPGLLPADSLVTIQLNKQATEYTAVVKNGDEIDVIMARK